MAILMAVLTAVILAVMLAAILQVKVIPASLIKPQLAGMDVANTSDY
jgi:hypothetical protein